MAAVAPQVRAETMVRIWERGRTEHLVDRALTILSLLSGRPRPELAAMPVARRDADLLRWRARIFSREPAGYAACPACPAGVEVVLGWSSDDVPAELSGAVQVGGRQVAFRYPTSLDLAAIAGCRTVEHAREILIGRCLADDLVRDVAVVAAVEHELARRAGASALEVRLVCPDCAATWTVHFDIAAFLWQEIAGVARRLLRDVDVLARRYGWTEHEILGLSPARRTFYLALDP